MRAGLVLQDALSDVLQDYGCITKAKVDPRELMRHMIVVQKVYKHCTSATRRKIVSCLIQCVHATRPCFCVLCAPS